MHMPGCWLKAEIAVPANQHWQAKIAIVWVHVAYVPLLEHASHGRCSIGALLVLAVCAAAVRQSSDGL